MEETDEIKIPEEVIAASDLKKKKRKRSLAQLPVYRDVVNLKLIFVQLTKDSPNSLRKFFDLDLSNISEVQKSIGFAKLSLDCRRYEDAIWYMNSSLVIVQEIRDDFTILKQLGIVDADTYNKAKALMKGVVAQLKAWRDYDNSEGANSH